MEEIEFVELEEVEELSAPICSNHSFATDN